MRKIVLSKLQIGIIAGVASAILISGLAIFLLTRSSGPKEKPNSGWAYHIRAHTSGEISKNSTIKVVFNSELISKDEVGTDATKLFNFDPGLKGKGEWITRDTIEFVPTEILPPGKNFKVTLKLDNYIKSDEEIGDFFFYFDVITQDFDITFSGFRFPDLTNLSLQEYEGKISTADFAEGGKISELLTAKQNGKELNIRFEQSTVANTYPFFVEGIKRGEELSSFTLTWDGKPIDVDKMGEREIEVHPRGIFEVAEAKVIFSDTQYIEITFTDPLKQQQNLNGLIYIDGYSSRTEIDMNRVKLYPSVKILGNVDVHIEPGVRNSEDKRLTRKFFQSVAFQRIDPGVRFVGEGTILPNVDSLTIPFEAVNVHSVQVTAFKVYSKNIGQFFQVNDYKGSKEIKRVGRYLWRKTINLNATSDEMSRWTRYSLDVSELYTKYPDSLFQIELSINRSNSALPCEGNTDPAVKEAEFENLDSENVSEHSFWDYWDDYNYDAAWENRKNPCHDAYYSRRFDNPVYASKNFLASNIGLIAKYGSGRKVTVISTDILTAKPVSAYVKIYNYQNHLLGEGRTDGDGFGEIEVLKEGKPFYLSAENGNQTGYLKLNQDSALPDSHFDVGGQIVSDGLKGYIYGERGVWRPGDPIYLTFVLEDEDDLIPDDHPVSMELYNPKGQLKQTITNYKKVNDFYSFRLKTETEDITGTWTARLKLGGSSFTKALKIETVVPNRLKIELDMDEKELHVSDFPKSVKLHSEWLHGATASNFKTDISVFYSKRTTQFTTYKDYQFDDITKSFSSSKNQIFSGTLDENGDAQVQLNLTGAEDAPGMVNASFTTRVFEPAGGFSIETTSIPFHPYETYVGIKTPKGDSSRGMLLTDKEHTINIATVNSKGRGVTRNNVKVSLYKVSWRWWWNQSGDDLANYKSSSSTKEIKSSTISTRGGDGNFTFEVKYPSWGRYLLVAEDLDGGHTSAKVIYIDWPGWAGRAREDKGVGATRLDFTADKEKYTVGEKATIFLPESDQGYALVTVENGKRILDKRWIKPEKGKNRFELPIKNGMSPNIYVHVTLIQPHRNKNNDGPLRMYGIIPIMVEDPSVVLEPVLRAPEEIKPGVKTTIRVSEKSGKKMTYTIAIVDEGLLGLTRFRTPDLKGFFYQREALGVRTWDLFDDIVGAYGGELSRILALGGGDGAADAAQLRESRFPPIVEFLGPFELKSGSTNNHDFTLNPYIGQVRIMVVAGQEGAYGKTDKQVFVRQPLMIQTTLPRVLGPGEEIDLPVAVFTKKDSIKNVSVTIDSEGASFPDGKSRTLTFSKQGDKNAFFKTRVGNKIGKIKFTVTARSGSERDEQEIYIDVRSPNPPITKTASKVLTAGEQYSYTIEQVGLPDTNRAVIELSSVPPINLDYRLQYLIRYPHGCLEQTVSSVFPQLYLDNFVELTPQRKQQIEKNINAAVQKLNSFQLSSGGFSFWPANTYSVYDWADVYAGHFMAEADKKGYNVSQSLKQRWLHRQVSVANSWQTTDRDAGLIQAYRLYVLSLHGRPSMSGMNRLRESGDLEPTVKLLLSAAYHKSGRRNVAKELSKETPVAPYTYTLPGITFGSTLRDNAIQLLAFSELDDNGKAKPLADQVSRELSSPKWYSTQSTAFGLMAMSKFVGEGRTSYNFSYKIKIDGRSENVTTSTAYSTHSLEKIPSGGIPIEIQNTSSEANVYVTVIRRGEPKPGSETEESKGLELETAYKDSSGNNLEPTSIQMGEDFEIQVTVRNTYDRELSNLALTHIVPSGWQIHNTRFEGGSPNSNAEYQDFRDDRIMTYFRLQKDQQKTFTMKVNASYAGRYYLPSVLAEAMYVPDIKATVKGEWVEVKN
jgi:uncharacterized protein YfaS (alpha-2-macroglobulin family)